MVDLETRLHAPPNQIPSGLGATNKKPNFAFLIGGFQAFLLLRMLYVLSLEIYKLMIIIKNLNPTIKEYHKTPAQRCQLVKSPRYWRHSHVLCQRLASGHGKSQPLDHGKQINDNYQ